MIHWSEFHSGVATGELLVVVSNLHSVSRFGGKIAFFQCKLEYFPVCSSCRLYYRFITVLKQ